MATRPTLRTVPIVSLHTLAQTSFGRLTLHLEVRTALCCGRKIEVAGRNELTVFCGGPKSSCVWFLAASSIGVDLGKHKSEVGASELGTAAST